MAPTDTTLISCQQAINYQFKDPELLRLALTHASSASERVESNERLEFLGDAILGMVVCHELFKLFPHYLEGELTKIKSMIVSRRTCGRIAVKIGLTEFLHVGKGMGAQPKLPNSCAAAALEAVIGAVYVDGGTKAARKFILEQFKFLFDKADARQPQENFKSMLQQHAQRTMECTPIYELLDEKGPDHSKCFEVGVVIGSRRYASAWGTSKKEAEQLSAFLTLQELQVISAETKPPVFSI
ncbi:MAG: ribonuclease III [Sedimentisphaerales bacterium]|nr:ribonuclease III [Sedimentisphaerales bacterium]